MAERRKEQNVHDDQNAMAVVPHLPNLVIHHILGYLPTKLAIHTSFLSKNWLGIWSSLPVIDLQEEGNDGDEFNMVEDTKFTNFLVRYLELRDKDSPLEKLRLHMRSRCADKTVVERLLSFSATKSVKELDICFMNLYYYFPHNILNAKTITALSLECVSIKATEERISFPSLKTISLNRVEFGMKNTLFMSLISRSPSIEHISVNSCHGLTVLPDKLLTFTSSSLKSLEVSRCKYSIKVTAANLESFTLLASEHEEIAEVTLDRCRNLKHINIHAGCLYSLDLLGCHDSMKATIDVPGLSFLSFNGYMKHHIIEKTRNLYKGGIVAVRDRKPTFESSWKHFSTLSYFLEKGYGSCYASIRLIVYDPEAWTFPKDFRKICSPPLPLLTKLQVDIVNYPTEKIDSEFWDSLRWMAPKAIWNPGYCPNNL
ncbi:PREDICTED: F-box/FBD/LRR-repeat protein At2g26030-like [Fragaria vesca subsp. vesca]